MLDVFKQLCEVYQDPEYNNILAMLEALQVDMIPFEVYYGNQAHWYTAESAKLSIVIVCTNDTVELQISGAVQFQHLFESV